MMEKQRSEKNRANTLKNLNIAQYMNDSGLSTILLEAME